MQCNECFMLLYIVYLRMVVVEFVKGRSETKGRACRKRIPLVFIMSNECFAYVFKKYLFFVRSLFCSLFINFHSQHIKNYFGVVALLNLRRNTELNLIFHSFVFYFFFLFIHTKYRI